MGCLNQDCQLCKNNPHKVCDPEINFDEAYADNQVLKARCEAEVYIELMNQSTGEVFSAQGVEVQVSGRGTNAGKLSGQHVGSCRPKVFVAK